MSKPRYKWWSYVQWMIRLYPGRVQLLRDMQSATITAKYSAAPRSGGASRTTERLAMASLGDVDREVEAVRGAIEETEARKDGKLRMKLIRLYYWDRIGRIDAVARRCHISEATARRWHGEFVRAVAMCFGLPM